MKKRNLIFLHGWGYDVGVFDELIENLGLEYSIKTINLPGYAGTQYRELKTISSLSDWVDQEISRVSESDQKNILIAWSLGALVAIKLLADHSDRFSHAVLLSGTPCFAEKSDWPDAMKAKILDSFIEKYETTPKETQETFSYLVSEGELDQRNWLKVLRSKNQSEPSSSALEDGLAILKETDLRKKWTDIQQSVLGIYGKADTLVPVDVVETMQELNPRFKPVIVENAGHAVFMTHPQKVAGEILAFLRHAA